MAVLRKVQKASPETYLKGGIYWGLDSESVLIERSGNYIPPLSKQKNILIEEGYSSAPTSGGDGYGYPLQIVPEIVSGMSTEVAILPKKPENDWCEVRPPDVDSTLKLWSPDT